ncbi:hypothetical protein HID58_029584 [Brassica napus]|uniref:Gnk2-homologous domain-containing protein n=1 Tax=Brassica napus TaxID=3708 RepID=A0ABQ8CDL7_BRANA|nr:hypothetical protein HID58_029584 [Brassica napus]
MAVKERGFEREEDVRDSYQTKFRCRVDDEARSIFRTADEEAGEVPIAGEADTYEFDPVQGSFTANNTFAKNLNSPVSSLSSLTPKAYGFYSLSSGNSSGEPAYAIALCRREVKLSI